MGNALITGAAGFIGSHLTDRLLREGWTVTGLDNFDDFYPASIKEENLSGALGHSSFTLVRGDIRDCSLLDRLLAEGDIDLVFHLAARAGVRPSIERPRLYHQVNVEGTIRLLEACRGSSVSRIIFASSSSVYGAVNPVPFAEDARVDRPASPYAATKVAAEEICRTYHRLYGLEIVALRFFTVFGPRQRPEMAIHKFARLIDQGEELPIYGDGSSARDYTYISDIVDGVMAAIDAPGGFRLYNLGNSRAVSLKELVGALEEAMARKPRIRHQEWQAGDVPITCADIDRAHAELGYDPKVPLEDGLREFVAWFRRRPTA